MATKNEKEYLNCRINSVIKLLSEIVKEMEKWETESSQETEEE
jgi:hypothetical protein